jgi:hypothetical protein
VLAEGPVYVVSTLFKKPFQVLVVHTRQNETKFVKGLQCFQVQNSGLLDRLRCAVQQAPCCTSQISFSNPSIIAVIRQTTWPHKVSASRERWGRLGHSLPLWKAGNILLMKKMDNDNVDVWQFRRRGLPYSELISGKIPVSCSMHAGSKTLCNGSILLNERTMMPNVYIRHLTRSLRTVCLVNVSACASPLHQTPNSTPRGPFNAHHQGFHSHCIPEVSRSPHVAKNSSMVCSRPPPKFQNGRQHLNGDSVELPV